MSKIGVHQSTLCYNLNHYENKQIANKKHKMAYRKGTLIKMNDKNTRIYHSTT